MAQSIAGTQLATTWAANVAGVAIRVRADWNRDGDFVDAGEDVTSRVRAIQITHRIHSALAGLPLLGNIGPSTATLVLSNADRYFSPNNASGIASVYTALADGMYRIPVQIEMGYYNGATPEYLTQFVGEMEAPDESEDGHTATVTFECTDKATGLMQHKLTTGLMLDWRPDELLDEVLDEAGWTGTRSLDWALSIVPHGWLDDENAWDELQSIAASDGGMFYVSKEGAATFRRMTAVLERTDSRIGVAALNQGNASAYRSTLSWRDTYSEVIYEYSGRYEVPPEEVWRAPRYIAVEPGETATEEIRYRYPVLAAYAPVYDIDYRCVTSGGGILPEGAGGITVGLESHAQAGTLTLTNDHLHQTAYVLNAQVRGVPLQGEEAQTRRFESTLVSPLVEGKVWRSRGNPWLQTWEQAERMGGWMRDRLQRPRRLLVWRGPACPWIEMLDRVVLSHNTMTPNPGESVHCYVVGNGMRYSAGAMWTQELILLPVTDLFAHANYFIPGESYYADSGSHRVGY